MLRTYTHEELDATVFHHIWRAVVDAGYLPDKLLAATATDYKNAKDALRSSLPNPKQLIEVFGVGTGESRGEKKSARITINRRGSDRGSLGGAPAFGFEAYDDGGETKYRKKRYPAFSENVTYDIRLIADNTHYERIMQGIILSSLGRREYLYVSDVENDGMLLNDALLVEFMNEVDVSAPDMHERLLQYRITDVWLDQMQTVKEGIPPMNTVDWDVDLEE
jgi:hypothetical protein